MKFKFFILALLLANAQANAESYDSQFSLSLDLLGQAAFAAGGPSGSSLGVGGSFFADWRPLPYLSLGTGMDFTDYSSSGGWQTSSWNLGGRIFPAASEKDGELYLQGTAGLDVITKSLEKKWPGSFHGSAGVGYRAFMGSGNALDFGVQYDLFSPISKPLSDVGIKVGWTFLFGETPVHDKDAVVSEKSTSPNEKIITVVKHKKKYKKSKKQNQQAEVIPTPTATNVSSYAWVAGDQLESLAEAFLGRGNLYPLIVDANRAALGSPAGLVAGAKLTIPENPSDSEKEAARAKANQPDYLIWARVGKPY